MADELIDKVVDRQAVQADVDFLTGKVNDVISLIKSTKGAGIDLLNANNLKEYNAAVSNLQQQQAKTVAATDNLTKSIQEQNVVIKQEVVALQTVGNSLEGNIELRKRLQNTVESYKKSQKEDLQLLKQGTITREEYNSRINEGNVKLQVYKQRIQDLNKTIGQQTREQVAVSGSVDQLRAKLLLLTNQYDKLSAAQRNSAAGLALKTQIQQVTAAVTEQEQSLGKFQRNVGNYQNAITQGFSKAFSAIRTIANILPGVGLSGVFLLAGTAIEAFVGSLFKASDGVKELRKEQDEFKTSLEGVGRNSIATGLQLQNFVDIAKDGKLPLEQRNNALAEANKILGDHSEKLTLVNVNTVATTESIKRFTEALIGQAVAAKYADRAAELVIKQTKASKELATAKDQEAAAIKRSNDANGSTPEFVEGANQQAVGFIEKRISREKELNEINKELAETQGELLQTQKKSVDLVDKPDKADKKAAKRALDLLEARRKALLEIAVLEQEQLAENARIVFEDENKSYLDRLIALRDYHKARTTIIDLQTDFEQGKKDASDLDILLSEQKNNDARIKLARETNTTLDKIRREESIKPVEKATAEEFVIYDKFYKSLEDRASKYYAEKGKKEKEDADQQKKFLELRKQLEQELVAELIDLGKTLINANFERQKNAIADQIDLLELQKQKDIEVANQSIVNAQDRAAAITVIEARAAAQREQLEKRQRVLAQQQARFEKASSVANIIAKTAEAILGAIARFPGPQGVSLALLYGAIGAAELAKVVATPIPKYRDGTKDHPGGLFIAGDGGKSELVVEPDGKMYRTGTTPALYNAPAGTVVHPDAFAKHLHGMVASVNQSGSATIDTTGTLNKGFKSVVKAIKSQRPAQVRRETAWSVYKKTGSIRGY